MRSRVLNAVPVMGLASMAALMVAIAAPLASASTEPRCLEEALEKAHDSGKRVIVLQYQAQGCPSSARFLETFLSSQASDTEITALQRTLANDVVFYRLDVNKEEIACPQTLGTLAPTPAICVLETTSQRPARALDRLSQPPECRTSTVTGSSERSGFYVSDLYSDSEWTALNRKQLNALIATRLSNCARDPGTCPSR